MGAFFSRALVGQERLQLCQLAKLLQTWRSHDQESRKKGKHHDKNVERWRKMRKWRSVTWRWRMVWKIQQQQTTTMEKRHKILPSIFEIKNQVSFCSFLSSYLCLLMCIYLHVHVPPYECRYPTGQRGNWIPWGWVTDACEPPNVWLKVN